MDWLASTEDLTSSTFLEGSSYHGWLSFKSLIIGHGASQPYSLTMTNPRTRVVAPIAVAPIDLHQEIAYWECREDDEDCKHTLATLLAQDPPSVAPLPFLLPRVASVEFRALKLNYWLRCYDSRGRRLVSLELVPDADVAVSMDAFALQGTRDFVELLTGAPAVKSLTIDTDFCNLGVEDIQDMLASLPSLEELQLEGRCSYSSLEDVRNALDPSEEAAILCPKLKTITVDNGDPPWYGGDGFFEEILPILSERAARGSRLRSLKLELMEGVEDEGSETEYRRLRATYLPELEKVVDEVTYDYVDYEPFDWENDAGI